MKLTIRIVGYLFVVLGLAWSGLSIISTTENTEATPLTFFGVILWVIGIGLLVVSRKLGDRKKRNE